MTDADDVISLYDVLVPLHGQMWRAPSAHNTQPWLLEPAGSDAVLLRWDEARTLPVADPSMRDLFLSLGAFVEQALTVAGAAGIAIDFEVDVDVPGRRAGRFVVVEEPYSSPFSADDAVGRSCNRGAYEPGPLPDWVIERMDEVLARSRARACATPARGLVDMLVAADRHMFGDVPTTMELRHWLRLSPKDPAFRRDGLTYTALDMSRGEAVALKALTAPRAYPALHKVGVPSLLASFSRPLLKYDGTVVAIVGPASSEPVGAPARHATEIAIGRDLLRSWLLLQAEGRSVHPLSQIIDAPATYDALHAHLGLGDGDRVFAIFRVGAATAPTPTTHRLVATS